MVQKIITFNVALKSTEKQWVQKIPEVYTNDLGSVSIQFNITDCTDAELTGSSAIVLLKMRDGSFFQGPEADVSRTLNVFSYTLKENEGNHDGLAEIQLIVSIAGKEFATQKYQFKVNSGLDSEVAREIMIYDWTTLTAEARAYIDQFTADEMVRDAEFDNNEFDRNTAFVASQDARTVAFGTEQTNRGTAFTAEQNDRTTIFNESESGRAIAETGRVTAEDGRVEAETDRVTEEDKRVTAESGRVTEEGKRVTAESGRVTAESGRVTAETNRAAAFTAFDTRLTAEETATAANKISAVKGKTFADVDARLEDVEFDTTLMATNLVTNGDFSNGATGWWDAGGTHSMSVTNGELSFTGSGSGISSASHWVASNVIAAVLDTSLFYLTVLAKSSAGGNAYLGLAYSVTSPKPLTATYQRLSLVTSYPSTPDVNRRMTLSASDGTLVTFTKALAINLTATFGAGNEPTVEQMDAIMAKFENSWFDSTKNLFRASETLKKQIAIDTRTEFEAKNLVVNGDFSKGVTPWFPSTSYGRASVISTIGNILSVVGTITSTVGVSQTLKGLVAGRIYYLMYSARVTNSECVQITETSSGTGTDAINQPLANTWYTVKKRYTASSDNLLTFYHAYASAEIAKDKIMEVKNVTVIDLTSTFGAGKEPTLAEMDRLMARFPNSWFDGVKPIQTIETLYQEKANKVQEAWINIPPLLGWTGILRVMKDTFGFVHLQAYLSGGASGTIGNIPLGYRPNGINMSFDAPTSFGGSVSLATTARVLITPYAGAITISGGSSAYLFINESYYVGL